MDENVVINGTAYNGVNTLALVRADGTVATFYPDAVRYNAQTLTEAQKEQARQNLGVGSVDEVAAEVLARLGTPVFGRVDADNNIILTGELADGTYTFVYEDEAGEAHTIGSYTKAPEVINQIPLSINTDGTQYVGTNGEDGYKTNVRLNSSGVESTSSSTGFNVTGFIPIKLQDVVYFKDVKYNPTEEVSGNYIAVYDSTFKVIASIKSGIMGTSYYLFNPITVDESGYITSITMRDGSKDYAYLRVSATGLNADSIITVNQPIA